MSVRTYCPECGRLIRLYKRGSELFIISHGSYNEATTEITPCPCSDRKWL